MLRIRLYLFTFVVLFFAALASGIINVFELWVRGAQAAICLWLKTESKCLGLNFVFAFSWHNTELTAVLNGVCR